MQKIKFSMAALLFVSFLIGAADLLTVEKTSQNEKTERFNQRRDNQKQASNILNELYPMDFTVFKKRVPSLSKQDKFTFLMAALDPEDVPILTGGAAPSKQTALREKILFLAPSMKLVQLEGDLLFWAYENKDKEAIALLKKAGYKPERTLRSAIRKTDSVKDHTINLIVQDLQDVSVNLVEPLVSKMNLLKRQSRQKEFANAKKMLRHMLPKIKNINELSEFVGGPLLHEALDLETAQMILNAGANLTHKNYDNLLQRLVEGIALTRALGEEMQLSEKEKQEDLNSINENKRLLELYMKHGADPLRKNKQGKSAMDIAKEKGLDEVIAILQKKKK